MQSVLIFNLILHTNAPFFSFLRFLFFTVLSHYCDILVLPQRTNTSAYSDISSNKLQATQGLGVGVTEEPWTINIRELINTRELFVCPFSNRNRAGKMLYSVKKVSF